jgi:hypothetical protein
MTHARAGQYECPYCGDALDLPPGDRPHVIIHAMCGRCNTRTLYIEDRAIHTCDVGGSVHAFENEPLDVA